MKLGQSVWITQDGEEFLGDLVGFQQEEDGYTYSVFVPKDKDDDD